MENVIALPGIVSDIDGVIQKGTSPLEKSPEAIKIVKTALKVLDPERFGHDDKVQLPFVCLTNVGDLLETDKADDLNNILGLTEPEHKIVADQVLLNYSCLKPVFQTLKNKPVLVSGLGDVLSVFRGLGLNQCLTIEEYCDLYPLIVPSTKRPLDPPAELVEDVRQRLGLPDTEFLKEPLQIHGVFFPMCPENWDEAIQVVMDLVSTEDGTVPKERPKEAPEKHIPIYFGANDLYHVTDFPLPRLSVGFFKEALELCYKKVFNKNLKSTITGKPSSFGFEYAKRLVASQTNYPISNFYMIGDNPKTDIRGAKNMGWKTILVKSGVFADDLTNDPVDPADYVCATMYDAIKLILKNEGIKCNVDY